MSAVTRRRLLAGVPVVAAGLTGLGFLAMLDGMRRGAFDPHDVGSPVIGRAIPDFDLAGLPGARGFSADALRTAPAPVLLNFFASWCIPCIEEQAALAARPAGLALWGIAYKDAPDKAAAFAARSLDRYARLASDENGTTAIDFGVTGVPESFLVRHGRILVHVPGPLTPSSLAHDIAPHLS